MTPQQLTATLRSGAEMPLIGLGTWQASGDDARTSVLTALEVGYRHIDTATGYANEDQVGRALAESDVPRDEVFVTTKLPPDHAGRERETLETSLSALGLDSVDLWLVHWPPNGEAGVDTWKQFVALQQEGLAKAIGVSNYSTAQVDELVEATGVVPEVNQIRWSPAVYDAQRAAELDERGVVLEGYSPFKASDLDAPVLHEIADAHGTTPAQVVLRWHLDHGVVVIPKSTRRERIASNFDVLGFSLSADELARIDALSS